MSSLSSVPASEDARRLLGLAVPPLMPALQASSLLGGGPGTDPGPAAEERPALPPGTSSTRQEIDTLVAKNRLATPPAVTEGRRARRVSVGELDGMDPEELRQRFLRTQVDGRGPLETVLDWIDLPRNVLFNALAPGLAARQSEKGERGALGLGKVSASDVLDELGVSNGVARGILGFVGDVALDPLTYVGPAGWGAKVGGVAAKGERAAVALRGAGKRALRRGMAEAAAGGRAADDAVHAYLEARGLGPAWVQAQRAAGKSAAEIQGEIAGRVLGTLDDGRIGRAVSYIGGEEKFRGAGLAEDFYAAAPSPAADAARALVAKYGEGFTEPGLRLGVGAGEPGMRIAHVPFTDLTLTVPDILRANGKARKVAAIANLKAAGLGTAAVTTPEAMEAASAATRIGELQTEIQADAAKFAEERAAHEARVAEIRKRPPEEPPPGTPAVPETPTPGGPAPAVPAAPDAPGAAAGAALPDAVPATDPAEAARTMRVPMPRQKTRRELVDELHNAFGDVEPEARLAAIALHDARGAAAGADLDQWWGRTIAGFRKGLPERGEPLYQIDAWHGSPHRFDKFSTEKIGTGEGAQAYGWGLYFAGNRGVAEGYRAKLAETYNARRWRYRGVPVEEVPGIEESRPVVWMARSLAMGQDFEAAKAEQIGGLAEAIDDVWRHRNEMGPEDVQSAKQYEATLRRQLEVASGLQAADFEKPGALYKVTIAPEEHDLLHWDRRIDEHPAAVRAVLDDLIDTHGLAGGAEAKSSWDSVATGPGRAELTGADVYRRLSDALGSDRMLGEGATQWGPVRVPDDAAASRLLRERGVPGIKFLDGNSRGIPPTPQPVLDAIKALDHLGYDTPGQALGAIRSTPDWRAVWDVTGPEASTHADLIDDYFRNPAKYEPPKHYNYVIFHDADVGIDQVFQRVAGGGAHGAATFIEDGRAVVSALSSPNASTLPHEFAHVWRRALAPHELDAVARHYGVGPQGWTRAHEERYAEDFERYLATGRAPTDELKGAFDRFRDWMVDLYRRIVGTPLEERLSPQMRRHFDRILGGVPDDLARAEAREVRRVGSRAETLRRLTEAVREEVAAADPEAMDAARMARHEAETGQFATPFTATFAGPIPKDLLERLTGSNRHLLRYVRANVPGGRGADALAEMGEDAFVDMLRASTGSERIRALRAAQTSRDPAARLYRHLWDTWPRAEAAISKEAADFVTMPPGTAFAINGEPMAVVRDAAGERVVRWSGGDVPADLIGRFAVDEGSVRALTREEAAALTAADAAPSADALAERMRQLDAMGAEEDDPRRFFQRRRPDTQSGALFGAPAEGDAPAPGLPGPRALSEAERLAANARGDVAGQTGLFGGGYTKAPAAEQGRLFGGGGAPAAGAAEALPGPGVDAGAELPLNLQDAAIRPGETAEEYRIRMLHRQSEAATRTLFQGGDPGKSAGAFLPPDELETEVMRFRQYEDGYRAAQKARLEAVRAETERARAALASLDPAKLAATPQGIEAALVLSGAYDDAIVAADRAAADAAAAERFERLLPHLDHADPEVVARALPDALVKAHAQDPQAAEALAEAAAMSAETAWLHARALQGQIVTMMSSTDAALAAYAKQMLSLDDDAVALTAFGRVAEMMRGEGDKPGLVRRLEAADEATRRIFGHKAGHVQRYLAGLKADARGANMERARWVDRTRREVMDALRAHGAEDHVDEAMTLALAKVYQLADPGGHHYFTWAFHEGGAAAGGESALVRTLREARANGILQNDGLNEALDGVAARALAMVKELGDRELRDGILPMVMAAYVPAQLTEDAARLTRLQKAMNAQRIGRSGGAREPFAIARTTWQTRFQDPAAMGRWRRFFEMDRWLLDRSKDIEGRSVQEIAAAFGVTPKQAQEYAESYAAMKSYDAMVEASPEFARAFPPRPTDPFELNQLWDEGRFGFIVGGDRSPERFFDTDLGRVLGARMGQHQRAVAHEKLSRFVDKLGVRADPRTFAANDLNVGQEGTLANGVRFVYLGDVGTNAGGRRAGVRIGRQEYRLLDKGVANSLVGSMLKPGDVESLLLPKVVADKIEDVARILQPAAGGDFETLMRTVDEITGIWKKVTLFRPSWTVMDMIGNAFLAVSGGARPRDLVRFTPDLIRLRRLRDDPAKAAAMVFRLSDGRTIAGDKLLHLLIHHRIFDHNFSLEVAGKLAEEAPGWLSGADRAIGKFPLMAAHFKLNHFANDVQRGAAFMSHLEQGHDVASAAQRTLDSMFDWSDFTRVEERVFRKLFPFYSWMRNNLGYQLHLFTTRPVWAASTPKLAAALEEVMAGDAVVPEDRRPGWMRESLAAQLTEDPGARVGLMFGDMVPTADVIKALQPIAGPEGAMRFAKWFASSLNPALSVPLQLGAGTEFFSGRRIGPDGYSGDLSAADFLLGQVGPLNDVRKLADAAGRSPLEAAGRALLGGRVQDMSDERLAAAVDREERELEAGFRGAVARARRKGDQDAMAEAMARLLRLYERRKARGQDVPNWADARLAEIAAAGGPERS